MTKPVGAEFPLFAFSHCRDVAVAVSRAGGFGVLGGARFSAQSLEQELKRIDDHVDGKPCGIDILIPEHQAVKPGTSAEAIAAMVPDGHRIFVQGLLRRSAIEPKAEPQQGRATTAYDGEPLLGQGVGLIDGVKSAARVVQDFKEDFAEAMSTVMGWSE
ncbi:MAG: nitronate monooxygenase [Steroidobacteraceae bacterium]